ncbi:MAG TPA: alpha-hydroxy acid oxidase [Gammaproteobacteria bacterium]|nr:alpha-hydroxy acid oxidase [Gammaproteobacteria bacterium]
MPTDIRDHSRRQFLSFLAGSPLLCGLGGSVLAGVAAAQTRSQDDAVLRGALEFKDIIKSVDEALNVWDFEPAMRARVNAGHYAYMAQGADDFGTIAANRAGFAKIALRPQRLVDVSEIDMTTEIFGQRLAAPLYLCPIGAQQMFHPDGEVAVARGAKSRNVVQALSTVTNYSVEDVAAARGAPGWYQLYSTSDWPSTLKQIKRAEAAGCTALAWTVDIPARNLEPIGRFHRDKDPLCQACHSGGDDAGWSLRPMFKGIDMKTVRMGLNGLTWSYIDQLKKATTMKVMVKGIVTREDAARCLEHGVDGIIVSNHGGRADETLRGAIDSLPEVLAVVRGRVPVFVDSGFRRGTDIFKALALGATAVGIGRPYIWGLGSFGQEGVEKVIDILMRELRIVMMQMGTPNLGKISRNSLQLA